MNRNVETVVKHYPEQIPAITKILQRNQICYLVTDDAFAHDAQIWSPTDARDILAQYARQDVNESYRSALRRVTDNFHSSRSIYAIDRADLAEIRKAVN